MIIVAGAGPGNKKLLTNEVIDEIKSCENVIAFGRVSKTVKEFRDDFIKVTKVSEVIENIKPGVKNLILASGDPLYFGITNFLKASGIEIDAVLPGISSFQYMAAKLQKPWQNANLFSLHGRDYNLEKVKNYELSILFTDAKNTPGAISKKLKALGIEGVMHAGYNLSYDTEIIETNYIGEDFKDISSLAVVVIEREMD